MSSVIEIIGHLLNPFGIFASLILWQSIFYKLPYLHIECMYWTTYLFINHIICTNNLINVRNLIRNGHTNRQTIVNIRHPTRGKSLLESCVTTFLPKKIAPVENYCHSFQNHTREYFFLCIIWSTSIFSFFFWKKHNKIKRKWKEQVTSYTSHRKSSCETYDFPPRHL